MFVHVAGCYSCTYQYVSLYVPDCSRLTLQGLLHFSNFSRMEKLTLGGMNAKLINGQDWSWIRGLSPNMKALNISGELR